MTRSSDFTLWGCTFSRNVVFNFHNTPGLSPVQKKAAIFRSSRNFLSEEDIYDLLEEFEKGLKRRWVNNCCWNDRLGWKADYEIVQRLRWDHKWAHDDSRREQRSRAEEAREAKTRKELVEQVNEGCEDELKAKFTMEFKDELKEEAKGEMREELEGELRARLREELKEELRSELEIESKVELGKE